MSTAVRIVGIIGVLCVSSFGAEYAWVPVGASGGFTLNGNEIVLQGPNQTVTFELRLSGWDPGLTGSPELGPWQATVDATGYLGANATPPSAVDLLPVGWPDMPQLGGYQFLSRCFDLEGDGLHDEPCGNAANGPFITEAECLAAGGLFCVPNLEFVLSCCDPVAAVSLASLNFTWGAAPGPLAVGGAVDDGTSRYGGTLVLNVPTGASGTYTIIILDNSDLTFMSDAESGPIAPLTLTPGRITIACATDADCNDNNACTIDSCQVDDTCSNTPNFDDATFCCDPTDGSLTPLNDGNECTDNVCNANGTASHPPLSNGTLCGNPASGDCDAQDTCDGAGNCDPNLASSGTPCGDPADSDCNGADTCDATGQCLDNLSSPGAPCDDAANTDCDNPDSCNEAGVCLANLEPDGTICNDTLFCTVDESCVGGTCGGGAARDCSDALLCTTDTCNETDDLCEHALDAGHCLIVSVCYADNELNPANDCQECDSPVNDSDWSFLSLGSQCDDGNPCTGTGRPGIGVDICDGGGLCSGVEDPECNDDCDFAIPAVVGANSSANNGAGADDAEASCQPDSNSDVWFVFEATCEGPVFMSTTGSLLEPSNDPVLNVFDACNGNEIACDDDSGTDLHAALSFDATLGVSYWVRVAGFEDNVGTIVLNIDVIEGCIIDGTCYAQGESNPENACEICEPAVSTTSWSSALEGTACGDPSDTVCDSPDACNAGGICETNPKPDGTECPNDGNECSFDVCESGQCAHPPVSPGTSCGDPSDSECDHPDGCDGAGTCLDNFETVDTPCGDGETTQCDLPDICDGAGACDVHFEPNGTACDDVDVCTRDDACAGGACIGVPIPEAPLLVESGPRSFSVTAQPSGTSPPMALHLTSPSWPCLSKYLAADGTLVDTPVLLSANDWGTRFVLSDVFVPSSTYEIRAECGAYESAPGTIETCLWGDVNCNGATNFADIQLIVLGFQGFFPETSFEALDLHPCTPNRVINFADIQLDVLAFQGQAYFDLACPVPCP